MFPFSSLAALAQKKGLNQIAVISTDKIKFNPTFRKYCEENQCGNYGVNYACPPDCGSTDFMKEKVLKYDHALVMQSIWKYDELSNVTLLKACKKKHIAIVDSFLEEGIPDHAENLLVSAGPCTYCSPCAKAEGKPCRFPKKQRSCLSAYCIDAAALADASDMICWYKDNTVAYFSIYVY